MSILVQVASAPIDCLPEIAACTNGQGEEVMEADDEYTPTDEQAWPHRVTKSCVCLLLNVQM